MRKRVETPAEALSRALVNRAYRFAHSESRRRLGRDPFLATDTAAFARLCNDPTWSDQVSE